MPIMLASRADPPEPGIMPSRISGKREFGARRRDAEIAGKRQLESDAEAIAADGGDHRLAAAFGCGDVVGEMREGFGLGLEEARDVAAARKIPAFAAQHDDAHARIAVERGEGRRELRALRHRDDVQGRPVEHDVGARLGFVPKDAEPIGRGRRIGRREVVGDHGLASRSNAPLTSRRRKIFPTGDFGISATKT